MKILSFNAGLLTAGLFGIRLYEPTPYVKERFERLAEALKETGADVIALQEVYDPKVRQELIGRLMMAGYSYAFHTEDPSSFGLDDGLLLLSRYEIRNAKFVRFQTEPLAERIFATKGALYADIKQSNGQTFSIANVHATSGGYVHHPESDTANRFRSQQIAELFELNPDVLVGDFNCSPEASPENYNELCAKYQDTCDRLSSVTWDPQNPLNVNGPYAKCPPQRCDHIFAKEDLHLTVQDAELVLRESVVQTKKGQVPLSDHYGIMSTLV